MKEMVWYMDGGEKCVGSTVWFEETVWKCLMEAQKQRHLLCSAAATQLQMNGV